MKHRILDLMQLKSCATMLRLMNKNNRCILLDFQCMFMLQFAPQELLALVNHLDKEGKGYVSVDEFVGGLHSMCTSASVASSTPPFHCRGKTQKSDMVYSCPVFLSILSFFG